MVGDAKEIIQPLFCKKAFNGSATQESKTVGPSTEYSKTKIKISIFQKCFFTLKRTTKLKYLQWLKPRGNLK